MRNGPERPDAGINLTQHLTAIIAHIVSRSPSLGHIDVGRVLVCIGSNRGGRRGGLYGKLIPLRFENGSEIVRYRGRYYTLPAVSHNGADCLYIIYFYMPRFFDLPWTEKLRVMFHELYHISPRFDGDIRRMGAVKTAHGHSKKHFDSLYASELNNFADHIRDTPAMDFLAMNTGALYRSYRRVTGVRMKSPKPVLLKQ
jgi:predicted metallopeptidase